jgi:hypothetical protein
MQFREGGIIGYAGPEGSDVRLQPIPDREPAQFESMAERAERQRREKGSIYDPFYGLPPEVRAALEADKAAQREGTASPESYTIPGPGGPEEIPRTASERKRLEERRAALEARQQMVRELQARRQNQQQGVAAALEGAKTASAQAGGARRLEDYYVPYPERGPMRATTSTPGLAAVLESEFQRGAEAGPSPRAEPQVAPPEAPPKPASAETRPETPSAPSGIAAVAPRERPTLQGILNAIPEDKAAAEEAGKREAINARLLEMRRKQPDLAAEGIAAIGRSEAERKRLLELQRSEDSLNSLIRLGQALRTGGDQYMAYSAGMKARDEADRVATLASQEAVLKLKQAQQAREIGDVELEKKFLDEAAGFRKEAQKARMEQAKAEATLAGTTYQTDVQASTAAANRAQDLQIKLMELKQKAEADNNIKLSNQITLASQRLAAAQRNIAATLEKEFPDYATLVRLQGVGGNLSDSQKKSIQDYQRRARQLEASTLAPIEGILAKLSKDAGVEIPQAAAPSAPGVDFSKLPK